MSADLLNKTPLHAFHMANGARMVPFAGYDMPVQYPMGVLKEHLFVREKAGLFDVSHMGQALLHGTKSNGDADVAKAFEILVPGNIAGLKPGGLRYTMLLNEEGGILDDLMVTRYGEEENTLYLVVNAACKEADLEHIERALAGLVTLERWDDRALLALQGPRAAAVLAALGSPEIAEMGFMTSASVEIGGIPCHLSRSGYTGEDGYEISLAADRAEEFARLLVASDDVEPIGLGARDSLRLEAGLCLYGSDIDTTTSPVEAALLWAIPKARREAGDFPGAAHILREIAEGPARKRVGILPDGRAPVRHGSDILDAGGNVIGVVTSGGFGPSAGCPVAMGYVQSEFAETGTEIGLAVRGKILPGKVAAMPFVEQRYYRKPKSS